MIHLITNQTSPTDVFPIASVSECLEYLQDLDEICLDLETTGLQFLDDKIIFLILGDRFNQYVIDNTIDYRLFKDIIESKIIIGQNLKFDYKFLKKIGIHIKQLYDTYIAERLVVMGKLRVSAKKKLQKYYKSTSLDAIVDRHLGIELSKETRKSFIGMNTNKYTTSQVSYAAHDIMYLEQIKELQIAHLTKWKELTTLDLENRVVIPLAEMEYEGMTLNKERWLELYEENLKQSDTIEKELNQTIIDNNLIQFYEKQYGLFDTNIKLNINWNSPQQVLELFKIFVPELDSTDSNIIEKHKDIEIIDKFIKYKELSKLTGTYGKAFLDNIQSDKRIHASFTQIINTSRMSSSKPNLQQIPSDNKYRNCFIPNYKDWVFVSSDFGGQELALIAHDSQDPVWLKALSESKDLHSICAELLFGKEWIESKEKDCQYYANQTKCNCPKHKELRTFAKNLNFMLAYGGGADKLSNKMDISIPEASKLINRFFTVFPNIKNTLNKLGVFGTSNRYIRTMPPFNTIRWFGKEKTDDKIERDSRNTRYQGSGANMTKTAIFYVWDYISKFIEKEKLPVRLTLSVHDEINTICHKDYAEQWKVILTQQMERAAKVIIPSGLLKAETKISNTWEK